MESLGLPQMPAPWRVDARSGSDAWVDVASFTDPLCPWAYSFEPVLRTLEARFGDQLRFRTVLIGLAEDREHYRARGSTPGRRAASNLGYRRFGMPIAPHVRSDVLASGPACRLIIAARRQGAALGDALLRLIRLAWFTTDLMLDEPDVLRATAGRVVGLDVDRAMNEHDAPDVLEEYQAGRREAREPAAMAVLIGRTARTDGPERYTAPTLVFTSPGGATAVVPGFQPYEAAEIALVNLKPGLRRLPVPRLAELLGQYPGGLTSQEVARVLADTTDVPDRSAAELAVTQLVADGGAARLGLADDALWRPRS